MQRLFTCGFAGLIGSALMLGCAEKTEVETRKVIETPEGTTEIETEHEIKRSGDYPPPATP